MNRLKEVVRLLKEIEEDCVVIEDIKLGATVRGCRIILENPKLVSLAMSVKDAKDNELINGFDIVG